MFIDVATHPQIASYISDCYHIYSDQPAIILSRENKIDITPLLIVHYVTLLSQIVAQGLKCGYLLRAENLHSKIKGKLLLGATIARNGCGARDDRNFCRYQDYTIDCVENQILKTALAYARSYLSRSSMLNDQAIHNRLHLCASALTEVSGWHSDTRASHFFPQNFSPFSCPSPIRLPICPGILPAWLKVSQFLQSCIHRLLLL